MADGVQGSGRPRLRIVNGGDKRPEEELTLFVRAARRDMARLLRGIQATGRGIATWPDEVITRLAHIDAVTARHLIDQQASVDADVRGAASALRALERWVVSRLTAQELAQVRAFELMIRIPDRDLHEPLLRPDGAPEDDAPSLTVTAGGPRPRSLREGLRSLLDRDLTTVCRRLGIRPLALEGRTQEPAGEPEARARIERAIITTLRDDHLLGILVATLPAEIQELLAALVRGRLKDSTLNELAAHQPLASAVGAGGIELRPTPVQALRMCGLLFIGGTTTPGVWVPVELQRRLDGMLRTFGR